MGIAHRRFVFIVAALVVFALGKEAWAWGPGTHVKLASDLLSNLWMLPAGLAALIARNRRAFLFGNAATDTVFAKKMSRIKQACHHWATGFSLLNTAETDIGRAFAYGYLTHLASDTVAHNKFLPHQMAACRSTVSFGHLYWEMRADVPIDHDCWRQLRMTLRGDYPEPQKMLRAHLRETMLSFRTNQVIFKRVNLLSCEQAWRRSVNLWSRLSRFELDPTVMADYHSEALERIVDVITRGEASSVLHEDPNGNAALGYAKAQRRQLRQMKRARMSQAHVIEEALAGHAPRVPSRALPRLKRGLDAQFLAEPGDCLVLDANPEPLASARG